MPTARRRLESKDIPQADSLENVRRIVDAVVDGLRTKAEVSERTGINPRHVLYGLHTARVLEFVNEDEGGGFSATELGKTLNGLTPNGAEEWVRFRTAVGESEIIAAIAPQLLSSSPPTQDVITQRIVKATGLSESTAGRRAQTLVSWRTQILAAQSGEAPPPVVIAEPEEEEEAEEASAPADDAPAA